MAFFEWSADMEIDGGDIDRDHRQLIEYINRLHEYTLDGQGREIVGEVLEQLLTYTDQHFEREERLMTSLGFPGVKEHHRKHQELSARMRELSQLHQSGSLSVASLLSVSMRDWLSLHIRRTDQEIRQWIKTSRTSREAQ
jgi:hemerythrin